MTLRQDEEVMAMICYDFPSKWDSSIRIAGKSATRTLSGARDAVAILNKEYGEGSHWVEPLNWTWAERIDNGETAPRDDNATT